MAGLGWSSRAMLDRYVADSAQRRAADDFTRFFDQRGRGRAVSALDEQAGELRARFPGWHVWYVPRAAGAGTWWSGQPAAYPLTADSPEALAALIEADQAAR